VLNGVLAGVVLPSLQAPWAPGVQGQSLQMCPDGQEVGAGYCPVLVVSSVPVMHRR
jgi:hypothetical protein